MIYYLLGIITGILITGFIVVFSFIFKTPMERFITEVKTKTSIKGSIIEPEDTQLEDWVESIKK